MKTRLFISLFLSVVVISAGCNSILPTSVDEAAGLTTQESSSTTTQLTNCQVTVPPDQAFTPPEPWPSIPPREDHFWIGDNGLWTALPETGSNPQLLLGEKFFWWSEEFDVNEDATPELKVTAVRLDGNAPEFRVEEATNAYHEDLHWAMLVGVDLESPGCWEFTGQYKDHELSFVVWVPEQ
jgi:hypothetical protein